MTFPSTLNASQWSTEQALNKGSTVAHLTWSEWNQSITTVSHPICGVLYTSSTTLYHLAASPAKVNHPCPSSLCHRVHRRRLRRVPSSHLLSSSSSSAAALVSVNSRVNWLSPLSRVVSVSPRSILSKSACTVVPLRQSATICSCTLAAAAAVAAQIAQWSHRYFTSHQCHFAF